MSVFKCAWFFIPPPPDREGPLVLPVVVENLSLDEATRLAHGEYRGWRAAMEVKISVVEKRPKIDAQDLNAYVGRWGVPAQEWNPEREYNAGK